MWEHKLVYNDGENLYGLKQLCCNKLTFDFRKDKKDTYVGLYCIINKTTNTKYRWVSKTEYELLKALKPKVYKAIKKGSIDFMYDIYEIKYLPGNQYKKLFIPYDKQVIHMNIIFWNDITYTYTAKFNLIGLIKQLKATNNLIQNYEYLECEPSITQVLTQIYYNPNYVLIFMKNPIEYLKILQDTDFYHYFKILHPDTTYKYVSIDTDSDNP